MTFIRRLMLPYGLIAFASAAPSAYAQATTVPPGFPAIAHVGIVVTDLDQAVTDATARFGLKPASPTASNTVEVTNALYQGKTVSYAFKVALLDVGNTQIEFIQPVRGPSPYSDALRSHPEGFAHHVAFAVPSIGEQLTRERKISSNLNVVLDAQIPAYHVHYVYVSGVLPGILVEFVETGATGRSTP
jgi:catechol 2,3-dioxygenase-like lactoylglutathione lyase family enzyme